MELREVGGGRVRDSVVTEVEEGKRWREVRGDSGEVQEAAVRLGSRHLALQRRPKSRETEEDEETGRERIQLCALCKEISLHVA